jgi:photosystem II stability/assembly factor-like uncharacterized protein
MNFRFFMKQWIRLACALSLAILLSGWNASPLAQAQGQTQAKLRQFDLLTANEGWVLLGRQLFRTSDAGRTWKEISPSLSADASIQDVEFLEVRTGWTLWTTPDSQGGASFHLDHTRDGGKTWTTRPLSLFEPGEISSYVEKAEMGWFDTQTGWIAVKQVSGSNFSLGTLFMTSDGGNHWNRSALPVADKITFSDPQTGWALGGPTGDRILSTQDAGRTWNDSRPSEVSDGLRAVPYPPVVSGGQGVLAITTEGTKNTLKVYSLESSGTWLSSGQVQLDAQPGRIAISILDPRNLLATIPGTRSMVRMTDGALEVLNNEDGLSTSISELDMVSLRAGWAKAIDTGCSESSCSSSTRLLQTVDGGITWQTLNLPHVLSNVIPSPTADLSPAIAANDIPMLENTEVLIGQGFDICEIPTLTQMGTWWDASPYQAVNLYIGGSSRACENSALDASYLDQLYQQGWKFIPTWVGPQAPCTSYPSRMSSSVTDSYQQGVNEADLAVLRLAELGLTAPDQTGSVVYYDIEPYETTAACRAAVNAFMNGWVSQLHAREHLAGVYGSTLCNTSLSDFQYITSVPDLIWPARWYHNLGEGYYDPSANVWNLGSCIPNTAWASHQRIRQYEGDHDELWGGLLLGIDSNVLDGVVAVPNTISVEVISSGVEDGWILETSESSNQGGIVNPTPATFVLGDNARNRQYRSILHFDTSPLPDNAVITGVTLKIKRQSVIGTDPFTTHGKIAVDIRKGAFSNSGELQSTDLQAAASQPRVGLISNNPQSDGWSVAALEPAYPSVSLTGITQLRLRFQKDDDNDSVADFIRFHSGNATTAANQPVLVIEYCLP